jgi:midasin (ATPase involved in ribosome maturation)
LEWYFRNRSSSSKINEYQFNQLLIPVFDNNTTISNEIGSLIEAEDFLTIINEIQKKIKISKGNKYIGWIKTILIILCERIKVNEQSRDLNLPKRERAFLLEESKKFQIYIDDILYLLYHIDSTQKAYIRSQIRSKL